MNDVYMFGESKLLAASKPPGAAHDAPYRELRIGRSCPYAGGPAALGRGGPGWWTERGRGGRWI